MAERIEASQLLRTLEGQLIHTISGQPIRVLGVGNSDVIVATRKSPNGKPVPIEWVQAALDRLVADGEVIISVPSVGYRSAFIGAVLSNVPGATVSRRPQVVRLRR